MIFKSYVGKRVMGKNKEIVFISELYETEDETEISALTGAMDVQVDDDAKKLAEPKAKPKDEKPKLAEAVILKSSNRCGLSSPKAPQGKP